VPVGREPEVARAGLAMLLEGVKAEIVFRSPRWKRGS
jgi:hypothetical protein